MKKLLALVLFASLSACTIYRSKADLDEIKEMAAFSGTLETAEPNRPVFIGLFRDEGGEKTLATYFVRYGSGPFHFVVPAGSYQLFAFEDANGNLRFDDGEKTYYVGDTQPPVRLAEGTRHDAGLVRLAARSFDATALRAAAKRDLVENVELTSVHRGTVASLDDPRFTTDTGKEGMWTPRQALAEHGAGLFFLEAYDPARIPVVFVHGFSGTAGDFKAFAEALDRRQFQVWLFQYPSGIRIETASIFLQYILAEMRARHQFERYIVVAHSAGGLVARSALLKIQKEGGTLPCAFVTMSTPWGGVAAAEMGAKHSPLVFPAWLDMAPGSPFIKTLFDAPLRPSVSTHLFFGYVGGNGTDGAMSLESMLRPAAQQQAGRVRGFAESHRTILRSADSVRAVNESLRCGP
jgi:pimeloyl-ACP methyl ester carboxylesterase